MKPPLVSSTLPLLRTTLPPAPAVKLKRSESSVCICAVRLSLTLSVAPTPSAVYQAVCAASVKLVRGDRPRIHDCPAVRYVLGLKTLSVLECDELPSLKLCELPDTDKPMAFKVFN